MIDLDGSGLRRNLRIQFSRSREVSTSSPREFVEADD
jgi:hypothetical protein